MKLANNVPIPTRNKHKIKYPFATMKVNQSFLYENKHRGPQTTYDNNLALSPKVFTCRKEGDAYRIWRIK